MPRRTEVIRGLRVAVALLLAAPVCGAQQLAAHRVTVAPVLDGRDTDAVWRDAAPASSFRAFRPTEGGEPSFRTEVRAVYDDRALYVLVRAHDPHPDSIISLLARRDDFAAPSDVVHLYLDSYHDGRNGYEFVVNPAGVKADLLLYDDNRFDLSWDGIWDVATRIDSLGWVAEFAIPFSQLRFREQPAGSASPTEFGVMVWRSIGRLGEGLSWPAYRPSLTGVVSQFGTLTGLHDLPSGVRMEAAPYVVTRGQNVPRAPGEPWRTEGEVSGGADLKFGPSPNVTVDATLNPDFGQIESDPAVLNLTSFETFLPERRPFFLEGAGLFRFTLSRDPNSPESLFYTRRIGRRPSLSDFYGDADTPTETTILGAGKLTARFGGNTSLASLGAVTGQERGAIAPAGGRYVVEPLSEYSVTRVQRDFRGGRSGIGFMLTGVNRELDTVSADFLPRQAVAGGIVSQHQSNDGQYWARFWAAASEVRGNTQAMTRVQLSSVHAFQRPDDHNVLDTTRTSLGGGAAQLWLGKTGGVLRYGSSFRYFSPGFDPTDVGFINEANHKSWVVDIGVQSTHATSWYRNAGLQLLHIDWWSGSGRIDEMLALTATTELPSQWRMILNAGFNQLFGTICSQRCTRGGPALRKDPLPSVGFEVIGDPRTTLAPDILVYWQQDDQGRSHTMRIAPSVLWRAATNLSITGTVVAEEVTNDTQFYERFGDAVSDTAHYTLARLRQGTRAVTMRVSYAATPSLSVQWYAQPFVSRGTFSDVRELNQARASDYALRLKPYFDTAVTSDPGGVNFQQFRSNFVTRWEYRPGSVLFLVWTQGRDLFDSNAGLLDVSRDARDLFALPPRNTIALKASYWYGR
ncbi:MAG TPA: DUF5916 domain-containing protein [Gemmatimonadaceae bacterium]|nr:DUF5916 domain-containing protein [Gemmatimonadaceae bacterium]